MFNEKINKEKIISALPFGLLFFYVLVRAITIDITHDEAYSFYNVKHFWWIETLCTGNTHWFNFAAIKVMVLFGLEQVFALRWVTLLSSAVFLIICFYWIKSLNYRPLKFFAFAFLLCNPYLLDYFSLARGYATGLMFEGLALFFMIKYFKKETRKNMLLSLVCAGMSAIANFNFFYFFAAFALVYFFSNYFKSNFNFFKNKRFYVDAIFSLTIIALVLKALWFITDCSNDIGAYGGNEFIHSLFSGYVNGLIYQKEGAFTITSVFLVYEIFVLVLSAMIYGVLYFKTHQNKLYHTASVILLIMFCLSVLNKVCFNVLYPIDRTTFMFFPLYAVVCIGFFHSVLKGFRYQKYIYYSIGGVMVLNLITNINFKVPYDYPEQQDAKESFALLEQLKAKKVGIAPELYGVFRNYYQMTRQQKFSFEGESINTYLPKGINANTDKLKAFDYLVLFPPYNLNFYKRSPLKLEGIKYYPDSKTLIIKVSPLLSH